jgi:hypothetical protein
LELFYKNKEAKEAKEESLPEYSPSVQKSLWWRCIFIDYNKYEYKQVNINDKTPEIPKLIKMKSNLFPQ